MMNKKELKVAVYIRVAHEDQISVDHQKETVLAYAKNHSYPAPSLYIDNGFSGLDFNRPAFLRLNADIDAGNVNTVIVRNESRIGRNYFEVENWIDRLEKKKVSVVTTDTPRNNVLSQHFNQVIATALRSYKGTKSSKKSKSGA